MVYPHDGIFHITDTYYNKGESWEHCDKWNKLAIKYCIFYDSI